MSILYVKIRLLVFLFCMSFSSFISAEKTSDLLSLYNEALRHDALLSAATITKPSNSRINRSRPISFITKYICFREAILISIIQENLIRQLVMYLLAGTKADYQNYEYGVVVRQPVFNYSSYNRYKQNLIQTSLK